MKKFFVILLVVVGFGFVSNAQNNVWNYAGSVDGVKVYWRYVQELKDQFRCELKFENTNNYKVDISFKSRFFCQDGTEKVESAQLKTLKAGETVGGQWQGCYYYPCKGEYPRSGGVTDMRVKKID